jgi:hypothetical protein
VNRADAAVVGTGPNGLSAAVTLSRAGLTVDLFEAADTVGGGLRTQPLFDSDIDICSAVHPMAPASRFFREFDVAARGVELLQPEIPYAHPLDGGRAAWSIGISGPPPSSSATTDRGFHDPYFQCLWRLSAIRRTSVIIIPLRHFRVG